MNRLVIIGASGHGKVIADIALILGYENIVFLDDNDSIKECAGFPVIGTTNNAQLIAGDKIVAIGDPEIRERISNSIETVTLVHPNAVISRRVEIGSGTVVLAGTVINSDTKIGKGCIINTCSSVDHDCIVGNFSHISIGAHIAGTCRVGDRVWVGAGSTVNNNIDICSGCKIGSGAVVVKCIEKVGIYVGIPAREKK